MIDNQLDVWYPGIEFDYPWSYLRNWAAGYPLIPIFYGITVRPNLIAACWVDEVLL